MTTHPGLKQAYWGHVSTLTKPSAIPTPRINSATTTMPSSSQSPAQEPTGVVIAVGVLVVQVPSIPQGIGGQVGVAVGVD